MSDALKVYEKMCDKCKTETRIRAAQVKLRNLNKPSEIYELIYAGLCHKCKHFLKGR